jgi:hypothetical protein
VAAIRRVRRLVLGARQVELGGHDYDRPGKPVCAWDDPQATQALVSGLVNDALAVLAAVGEVESDAEQAEAVALLALVAGQDVEPGQRPGSWRILGGSRPTGSSRRWIRRPGMPARPARSDATATRPMWPSSPRAGW